MTTVLINLLVLAHSDCPVSPLHVLFVFVCHPAVPPFRTISLLTHRNRQSQSRIQNARKCDATHNHSLSPTVRSHDTKPLQRGWPWVGIQTIRSVVYNGTTSNAVQTTTASFHTTIVHVVCATQLSLPPTLSFCTSEFPVRASHSTCAEGFVRVARTKSFLAFGQILHPLARELTRLLQSRDEATHRAQTRAYPHFCLSRNKSSSSVCGLSVNHSLPRQSFELI